MLTSVFLALVVAMVVGVVLVVLGVRGRRVNDHPTCRWCGFDLENIYPASVTCPECGAGLKREKAVRIGQRRRMPVVVVTGVMLGLLPVLPIGAVIFASVTGQDINRYKPVGLLLWEADRSDGAGAKQIAVELLNRGTAGTLSAEQEDAVVGAALARQENAGLAWDEAWGDLIERGRLNKRVSKEQLERYHRSVLKPSVSARPRVAVGQKLPVLVESETRVASTGQVMAAVWVNKATIGGSPVQLSTQETEQSPWGFGVGGSSYGPLSTVWAMGSKSQQWGGYNQQEAVAYFELPEGLAPGRHTLQLELLVQGQAWDMTGRTMMQLHRKPKADSPKVRRWMLETTVEVVPEEAGAIQLIAETPELKKELSERLTPSNVHVHAGGLTGSMVQMSFYVDALPAPVAYDVFLRVGEKETKVGSFTSGKGGMQPGWGVQEGTRMVWSQSKRIRAKKGDIVLRPSAKLAASTTDLTSIYNGELVFAGVDLNANSGVTYSSTVVTDVEVEASGEEGEEGEAPAEKKQKRQGSSLWRMLMPW